MGSSQYSGSVYSKRIAAKPGASFFGHTKSVHAGTAKSTTHESLDPSKVNKAGHNIRESRDSDVHPISTAVAILFDVTGSQQDIPVLLTKKLGGLMALLTKKAYIPGPHILFGGIGDAYSDEAPLQIGQFEGGNALDSCLSNIYLEGNGGGQRKESYELAMYYMARHTAMDCLDKRGHKGFLFLTGDELLYPVVSKDQVKRLIGDDLETDIPTEVILKEIQTKFEIFWIFPNHTMYWDDPAINEGLRKLFGERLLKLENPEDVCETISMAIGVTQGFDPRSLEADLIDNGSSKSSVKNASTALATYTGKAFTKKVATIKGSLPKPTAGKGGVSRV